MMIQAKNIRLGASTTNIWTYPKVIFHGDEDK